MSANRTTCRLRYRLLAALIAALPAACSDPTEPGHSDIALARAVWLAADISDYTFEVATQSSWFPRSDYIHVHVLNGVVATATDEHGSPINDYDVTIETIWQDILDARDRGDLNAARFDRHGTPLEANIGEWAVDAGYAYFVRNFEPDQP